MDTTLTSKLAATVLISGALVGALAAQERRSPVTRAVPIDLVCAPYATLTPPVQTMRIVGGAERVKNLFSAGETVFVGAGTAQGIEAGQRYYVRRIIEDRFTVKTTEKPPLSIHTAGWVTIVEVKGDVSAATVGEACDGIVEGDFLEPLLLPPSVAPSPAGQPDFERPAQVILGDDRRQLGAGGGALMVIDRGSDHGLRPGQRLTLFRRTLNGTGPNLKMGEAFVASTRPETSLIRIESSREAIQVGDLVAIHR